MYSLQDSNSTINGSRSNMAAAAAAAAGEAKWSWPDNKIFEDALVKFPEGMPDRWQKIAACVPGKSPYDVMVHYNALLHDVANIEAGLVQLPPYSELTKTSRASSPAGARAKSGERKKGKSWTVREHMLFLRGLQIYGKSDWRSISRNVVISRLPSQVASHAQKFFNRLKSGKKERKRSSIHDITSISDLDSPYTYTNPDSPYATSNNAYPSTEQHSPYTTSNVYPSTSTEQQPAFTTSMAYFSNEQSPYTTSNAYPSSEPSPSSMDCLAFGDFNNFDIDSAAVMAIPESYPLDYSFGEFNHLQM